MARNARSILIAGVLWVVILGSAAAIVRYFILPRQKEKERTNLFHQTGSEGMYNHKVALAADSFSGYYVFRTDAFRERLARQSIQFTVQDDGADYTARMKSLLRGEVQMAVFPVNSFIQVGTELGEFPATIIYLVDETTGADAIVADKNLVPDIRALNDRKARIVSTPDSPSEFIARVLIASFQLPELPEEDWMVPADGADKVYRKLRGASGKAPTAYALWEPYVSKALQDDGVHVLLDSSKLKGYIVDALVVERGFLVDHYDVVKDVVEAYAQTAYETRNSLAESVRQDADFLKEPVSASEAERLTQGILWKNTLENYAHFGLSSVDHDLDNMEDILQKVIEVLAKTDALPSSSLEVPLNSLFFTRILEDMKEEGFHPGRQVNVLTGTGMGNLDEQVRGVRQLEPLRDDQWERLVPVGEMRVAPITFGRGTARLHVAGRRELVALAQMLNSWPEYYLTVTGQVRPGGDEQAALALASSRADAAVKILVENGVAAERIRSSALVSDQDATSSQSVSFFVGQLPF